MSLITRQSSSKKMYTRKEDEIIIATYNDESDPEKLPTVTDVQKALAKKGFERTKLSLGYRLRFLSNKSSLDDIDYEGKNKGRKKSEASSDSVVENNDETRKPE